MPRLHVRASWLALLVFLVIWGLTTHGKYSVTGDEPHYLLVAESLRSDRDLDLANNYDNGDGRLFGHADLERGLHATRDRRGRLAPVHDLGLPLLVLPAYAVAVRAAGFVPEERLRGFRMTRGLFSYSLVSLSLVALSCGALYLAVHAARRRAAAFGGLVAVAAGLSPPFLSNAFVVFPEVPALAITAFVIWSAVGPGRRHAWTLPLGAAMLGLLPWFHRKFALFACAMLLVLLWTRRGDRASGKSRLPAALALFGAPAAALVLWSIAQWGSVGGPLMAERAPFSWDTFTRGIVGLFVDREHGLFVWAPVYLLLPAAWWVTRRETAILLAPALLLIVPAAAHDQWWGGFSPVGRFLLPIVPLFVVIVAWALQERSRALRLAFALLLLPQMVISGYAWQHPRVLWPLGDGQNRALAAVPGGASLNASFPAVRQSGDALWGSACVMLVLGANVLLVFGARPPRVSPSGPSDLARSAHRSSGSRPR
jgi:hypothetical protein